MKGENGWMTAALRAAAALRYEMTGFLTNYRSICDLMIAVLLSSNTASDIYEKDPKLKLFHSEDTFYEMHHESETLAYLGNLVISEREMFEMIRVLRNVDTAQLEVPLTLFFGLNDPPQTQNELQTLLKGSDPSMLIHLFLVIRLGRHVKGVHMSELLLYHAGITLETGESVYIDKLLKKAINSSLITPFWEFYRDLDYPGVSNFIDDLSLEANRKKHKLPGSTIVSPAFIDVPERLRPKLQTYYRENVTLHEDPDALVVSV